MQRCHYPKRTITAAQIRDVSSGSRLLGNERQHNAGAYIQSLTREDARQIAQADVGAIESVVAGQRLSWWYQLWIETGAQQAGFLPAQ